MAFPIFLQEFEMGLSILVYFLNTFDCYTPAAARVLSRGSIFMFIGSIFLPQLHCLNILFRPHNFLKLKINKRLSLCADALVDDDDHGNAD